MMRSLVCLPFCLVLFLLCPTLGASHRSLNCCLRAGKIRIPEKRVVDYTVQKAGVCPINAIILWTKRGKAFCSEPDSERIKKVMRMVDQKKNVKTKFRSKSLAKPKSKKKNGKRRKLKKQL